MRNLASAAFANAYATLTLTALFWAGNFVLGRGVHGDVPPIALAWCRWTLASLLLLPFAWPHLKRDWAAIRANWPILFALGAIGVGSFNTLVYTGLNHTSALNGLLLQSSGPILIVIVSWIFFRDSITPRQGLGIVVSLAGVLMMIARGDMGVLANLSLNKGDLWILAAFVVWAVYTTFLRKRPEIHFLSFLAVTFLVGAAVNTPFFIAEHLSGWQLQATWQTGLAIAYVAVFPSILAYLFYNRGVELIGGNRAGIFLHVVPLFGTVLAILLLGETLRWFHIAGFVLILTGVWLTARR